MTLKDIAKEAKVSITTVSLVLNGKYGRVSQATIDRILEIARKNNYQPNQIAVGLVTKKTKTIGLIVPDIQNTFFAEAAKHIEDEASKAGYNVILGNTNGKVEEDLKYINLFKSRGVDGLIISFSADSTHKKEQDYLLKVLNSLNIPFMSLDRWVEGLNCPRVSIDHRKGGYIATKYLLESGHTKVACLTGPMNVYTARRRLKGYQEALEEYGITYDEDLVFEGNYQFESGYQGGKILLKKDITAVFISNDLMSYGFYKAVRESGKSIPDDISIVGFDDLFFSSMLDIPLTTIKQPVDKIAIESWQLLLDQINGQKSDENIKLEPLLIERKSVKRVKE
jgi:LacI family transcriptional regulator